MVTKSRIIRLLDVVVVLDIPNIQKTSWWKHYKVLDDLRNTAAGIRWRHKSFRKLISSAVPLCKEQLLITGDFNFHIDDLQDPNASAFLDMYFYVVFFQSALTCACQNCFRVFSVEWAKGKCASPGLVTSNTFPRFIRFFDHVNDHNYFADHKHPSWLSSHQPRARAVPTGQILLTNSYQLSAVGSNHSLHLLNKLGRSSPFSPPPREKKEK